jgi:hypothetical protein
MVPVVPHEHALKDRSLREIDDAQIIATLARLRDRIGERFPGSGLGRVAEELLAIAHEASESAAYLRRPHWPVRFGVGLVIAAMLTLIVIAATTFHAPAQVTPLNDVVQGIEAGINDVIFLCIAVYFLVRVESRLKRRRALTALHELRSVVHIVDMHQLTKDPERLFFQRADTPSSPARTMTAPQLGRYLDYCSELLSLASKISALYVQHLNDPVVLSAVSEVETLAAALSSKIWQKITLLEPVSQRAPR